MEFKVIQPRIARVFTNRQRLRRRISLSALFVFICEILALNVQRLGRSVDRGGPQRSWGKENPGIHKQPLQEMISSWLGVTGVRAEEMTKSRKI